MKRLVLVFVLAGAFLTNINAVALTPAIGAACTQQNNIIKVAEKTLVCKLNGDTLKWEVSKNAKPPRSIVGQKCIKLNQTRNLGGLKFICLKSNKGLTWAYDSWSIPRKFLVVAFTPKDQPDFWSQKPTLQEFDQLSQIGTTLSAPGFSIFGQWTWNEFLLDSVEQTINFWKNSTNERLIFKAPEIIYAPPGTAKSISSCDLSADTKVALKYANLTNVPLGTHLVSINPLRKCETAQGMATLKGNEINLIGIYALAHEFGHNLGFRHSSTVSCSNNEFGNLNQKNCQEAEYGDSTDVMGSGPMTAGCRVSDTMRHIHLAIPGVIDAKVGETNTVSANVTDQGKTLYRLKLENIWFFFEYRNLVDGRDARGCYFDGESGVEVRFVGAKWPKENVYLVERFKEGEGRTQYKEGNSTFTSTNGQGIFRFKAGESIFLPGLKNKYRFTVLTTENDSASFLVEKI